MLRKWMCIISVVLVLSLTNNLLGDWTGAVSSDWHDAANWTGAVPTAGENAVIDSSSPLTWPVIDGGTANTGQLRVGYTANYQGELTVTGGATLTVNGELRIGRKSDGGSGQAVGVLNVSGANTTINVTERIEHGRHGYATLNMSGGYLHSDAELRLAYRYDAISTVYLRGGTIDLGGNPGITVYGNDGVPDTALIDISGGTLSLAGDQVLDVETFVSEGIIIGHGGETPVEITYDPATDRTLVKAPSLAQASNAGPFDEATDVVRQVVLDWTPALDAQTHNVYLGTVFEDVNTATAANPLGVLASEGQDANAFDAGVLEFGQTYYWRADGIGAAPDRDVFRGDTWSFSVEPFSYPIEAITAQASSVHDPNFGPENTVNGSGLDATDRHSTIDTDMWLSGAGDPLPWIQYEFNRVYKLHEMWVWNSNQKIEPIVGLGAREVSVEISTDGENWTQIQGADQFAQATGSEDYTHNTVLDFGGVQAQYCRITIHSGYGMLSQYGLSEVRFSYVPTFAREPQPASGATELSVDTVLTWRAGREAATHQVSLGTDPEAVAQGADPVTTTDPRLSPDALNLATTYYWQVTEINEAEDPSAHAGDIWSFSTQEYLVVDGFNHYDDNCNRIFFTWSDGLGHNGEEDCGVPPFDGNLTGSIVGNANAPFAERTIVHSGTQSMPLEYDGSSEATRNFAVAQDWTQHGIKGLILWFSGDPSNTAADLYVKINNTKVVYDGEADAILRSPWQMWYIDLQDLAGVNLARVTELTIGLTGGQGLVYIDDITLSPYDRQTVTPTAPAPANLIALYAFDGNARDSAGGLHGTAVGAPSYVAGQQGQALSLNTGAIIGDYIEISGYPGILGTGAVTVAAWINTDSDVTGTLVGWGPNVDGQRFGFRLDQGRLRTENAGGNVQEMSVINDGTWHHVAVTIQANATVSYPEVKVWVDGLDDSIPTVDSQAYDLTADLDVRIGSRPASDDRYYIGQIDELYLYDRALSAAEIAGLANRTEPFDVPFGTE